MKKTLSSVEEIKNFFDSISDKRDNWIKKSQTTFTQKIC